MFFGELAALRELEFASKFFGNLYNRLKQI